jgi:hypothetical protein
MSLPLSRAIVSAGAWLALACVLPAGCAPDPEQERVRATTKATYDKDTGQLRELTYDRNKNGTIDTWMKMDGTRPLSAESDTNENGKIDRWEYYGEGGTLERVALSRQDDGVPDMWVFPGPDGTSSRAEISMRQNGKIDRWEWYENDVLVRAEEDSAGDGRPHKWDTYRNGHVAATALDEDGDGRPDRRLTYGTDGQLVSIESDSGVR